jgi:hypothetical protein
MGRHVLAQITKGLEFASAWILVRQRATDGLENSHGKRDRAPERKYAFHVGARVDDVDHAVTSIPPMT